MYRLVVQTAFSNLKKIEIWMPQKPSETKSEGMKAETAVKIQKTIII